jgi:RNA polymerase sigma-70 factor (ECF subfamily)
MKTINLKDYYPYYNSDFFVDVDDDIALVFNEYARLEHAYQMRRTRNKAYYSLDRDDWVAKKILFVSLSPYEIYERKLTRQQLHAAISLLPDKQAKRIYAHFVLCMSKYAIAKVEGVAESCVRESINRGLRNMEIFLKK